MPEFEHTPALYSQNMQTKSQTYFFDLRQAKNGGKYVTITQSRIKDGQKIRHSLTVFADQMQQFSEVMDQVMEKAK